MLENVFTEGTDKHCTTGDVASWRCVCRAWAHRRAGTWKHSSLHKGQSKLSQDAPGSAFHWPGTQVWPGHSKKRCVGLLSYIQRFVTLMRWMKWRTMSTDFQRAEASQPFIYGPSRLTTMAPYTNLCSHLVSWPLGGPSSYRTLPRSLLSPGLASHLPKANPHKSAFPLKGLQNLPANSALPFLVISAQIWCSAAHNIAFSLHGLAQPFDCLCTFAFYLK